jgi:hypothetical protein
MLLLAPQRARIAPHLHVVLPEGLWSEKGDWVVLPPPEDFEVEAVLHRLLRQVRAPWAEVEERWPEDDLDVLRAPARHAGRWAQVQSAAAASFN